VGCRLDGSARLGGRRHPLPGRKRSEAFGFSFPRRSPMMEPVRVWTGPARRCRPAAC